MKIKRFIGPMVMPGLLASPVVVQAQDAVLEEVIVTAQRRAESMQDIPISVKALGGDLVREGEITSMSDVAQNVPNFTFAEFNIGQPIYSVRGILSAMDSAASDAPVALFIDDVYIGRQGGGSTDLFDLERIEVLRGPQGTLFGKNVVGGAIAMHTKRPTQELEADLSATVGNYSFTNFQGSISGPITDTVAAKLVAQKKDRDGYVDNVLLGSEHQDADVLSVRGQLEFNPTEDLTVLLGADYTDDESNGNCRSMNNLDLSDPAGLADFYRPIISAYTGGDIRKCASSYEHFAEREVTGWLARVEWRLNWADLTSITAYRDLDYQHQEDYAGLPLGEIPINFLASVDETSDQVSQEFRLTSNSGEKLDWLLGAFYMQENVDRAERLVGSFGPPLDDPLTTLLNGDMAFTQDVETTSYAVFGQIDYAFNEQWSVSIGSRYTYDKKEVTQGLVNYEDPANDAAVLSAAFGVPPEIVALVFAPNDPVIVGIPANGPDELGGFADTGDTSFLSFPYEVDADDDWSKVTSSASLNWNFSDDGLVYLKFSQGYKSGAFVSSNSFPEAAVTPLDPEEVDSWELGVKSELLDNRVRLNAALFSMDYSNLQVLRLVDNVLTGSNAKATSEGIELDITGLITPDWMIEANFAYLDATYDEYVDEGGIDYTGNTLPQAPEYTYFLRTSYRTNLSQGSMIDWVLSYSYTDSFNFEPSADPASDEDGYGVINANVTWVSPNENWTISAWGKNLNDEEYRVDTIIGNISGTLDIWGPPRTYGLTMAYSF